MSLELKMPALSPTMEEGTLAKWLVKEGDEVKSGDILAEIETDKATMEFEAVDEGVISEILIEAGTEGVKVGAVIARLAVEGEEAAAAPAALPQQALRADHRARAAAADPPGAPAQLALRAAGHLPPRGRGRRGAVPRRAHPGAEHHAQVDRGNRQQGADHAGHPPRDVLSAQAGLVEAASEEGSAGRRQCAEEPSS